MREGRGREGDEQTPLLSSPILKIRRGHVYTRKKGVDYGGRIVFTHRLSSHPLSNGTYDRFEDGVKAFLAAARRLEERRNGIVSGAELKRV